jgi:hypothetical protein
LHHRDEPEQYIVGVSGVLVHKLEDGSDSVVGSLRAQLVQVGRALDDGYPIHDVFDTTQELCELWDAFYEPQTSEFKEAVAAQFDTVALDILYLSVIEIDPKHRDAGLGLAAVSRCIDVWGPSEGLVACKPFPLQFDSVNQGRPDRCEQIGAPNFVKDRRLATQKLVAYWRRLGFKRLRRTPYAALSMTYPRPSIDDVLARRDRKSRQL